MRKASVLSACAWAALYADLLGSAQAALLSRGSLHAAHAAGSLRASEPRRPPRAAEDVDADFDKFLEDWFDDFTTRKPMEALRFGRQRQVCGGLAAARGARPGQAWGDPSAAAEAEGVRADERRLREMQERFGGSVGARDLSDERHVSYVLMQKKVDEMRQEHEYRFFRPPFGPLGCQVGVMGCQVQVQGMLRGLDIKTADDARCYVALLSGLPDFLVGHGRRLQEGARRGAPKYRVVLDGVEADCTSMLPAEGNGTASEGGQLPRANALFQAFEGKLEAAKGIGDEEKRALLQAAADAVERGVWPAYRSLREQVRGLLPKALESEIGLASAYGAETDASAFYAYRVQLLGVGSDASSLHKRALKLVAENAEEIRRSASLVLPQAELPGSNAPPPVVLQALRKPYSEARYADTEDGRALYLKDVEGHIEEMWKRLRQSADGNAGGRLFFGDDVPALPCKVQRIQSSSFPGLAQYNSGSVGKVNRSAVVAFNVNDMSKVSKMDMEMLAYHEVVPGHHLQITKAMTLPLPSFRRFFGDEAFAEGWAVYAEQDISPRLVKLSALSRLGRLNMLQTRAVRMAVDTGLHHLNWDRKKAEEFYTNHTMITPERAKQAVDRHFVWPAQALNYAAGHQELKRLRESVVANPGLVDSLGKDWEAMLHKAIISHGDLPLGMLEQVVFTQLRSWRPSSSPKSMAQPRFLSVLVSAIGLASLLRRSA